MQSRSRWPGHYRLTLALSREYREGTRRCAATATGISRDQRCFARSVAQVRKLICTGVPPPRLIIVAAWPR